MTGVRASHVDVTDCGYVPPMATEGDTDGDTDARTDAESVAKPDAESDAAEPKQNIIDRVSDRLDFFQRRVPKAYMVGAQIRRQPGSRRRVLQT